MHTHVGLNRIQLAAVLTYAAMSMPVTAMAQDAELAQKLTNPVASLISVPFQFNFDRHIGLEKEGRRVTLNVQPVIPISISQDWNLISRTIVSVIGQDDTFPFAGDQFGLGDTVQSLFFFTQATHEWDHLGRRPRLPTAHGRGPAPEHRTMGRGAHSGGAHDERRLDLGGSWPITSGLLTMRTTIRR